MGATYRWGILGSGKMAHSFAEDLLKLENARITAVAARSADKARSFASEFGIQKAYGSYEELLHDPDIDVVYIALPHVFHKNEAMIGLVSGKAVLCEKPFTVNANEADKLVTFARQRQKFLMEAMWTRFLPAVVKAKEWVNGGAIGEVRLIHASFGICADFDPQSRLFSLSLGGGSLLDVGIYPISFISMLFGARPMSVQSAVHIGETGVDEQFCAVMSFDRGRLATLAGAIRTVLDNDAYIYGSEGSIYIPDFFMAKKAILRPSNGEEQVFEQTEQNKGYCYEAAEVMRCLDAGRLESGTMPLEDSVAIMRILDRIRRAWGLEYPNDRV